MLAHAAGYLDLREEPRPEEIPGEPTKYSKGRRPAFSDVPPAPAGFSDVPSAPDPSVRPRGYIFNHDVGRACWPASWTGVQTTDADWGAAGPG